VTKESENLLDFTILKFNTERDCKAAHAAFFKIERGLIASDVHFSGQRAEANSAT
jgi:hypothetical protein